MIDEKRLKKVIEVYRQSLGKDIHLTPADEDKPKRVYIKDVRSFEKKVKDEN